MSVRHRVTVRFAAVDAAGIVFYPRYFEMLNEAVEEYFAQLGVPFRAMHVDRRIAVPTVKLESEFVAPSRLGDELDFDLAVARVGTSSAEFDIRVSCGGALRFTARAILVCMDMATARAMPWPADMRPTVDRPIAAA